MQSNQRKSALEKWKEAHREYYLAQKSRLAARPEYKALRRERYKANVEELTLLGILPRKRGRPAMYEGAEATEMRRQRAREASSRYRARLLSLRTEKDEYESETASESCNRSSSSDGSPAQCPEERDWLGPADPSWTVSHAGG